MKTEFDLATVVSLALFAASVFASYAILCTVIR